MLFTPNGFLKVGGAVLVLVGILGFVGVIGPTADQSVFGATWYFDNGENWAHLILGIVGLIAAFTLNAGMQKNLVLLLGVLGLFFAVYNLFTENFLGAMLQQYADTLLHLVVGVWAFYAALKKPAMTTAAPTMTV
jgi:hypothetical protein